MLMTLVLMSCSGKGIDPGLGLDYQYGRNLSHEKIVLGARLENPYKTENITKALQSLYPTKADRARYIIPGKNCGFRVIGYFMQSKLSECLVRNEKRERQVPKKGILATYNKIEMPSLQEGFNELNFVSIENGGFKISKWIENEI